MRKFVCLALSALAIPAFANVTMTFNANGGSSAPSKLYSVSDTTACKVSNWDKMTNGNAWKLLGWDRNPNVPIGTAPEWPIDGKFVGCTALTGDLTVYAIWGLWEWNLYFDKGAIGASGSVVTQVFYSSKAQAIIPCPFTYTGYELAGWADNQPYNSEIRYTPEQVLTFTGQGSNYYLGRQIYLKAIWKQAFKKEPLYATGTYLLETNNPPANIPGPEVWNKDTKVWFVYRYRYRNHVISEWKRLFLLPKNDGTQDLESADPIDIPPSVGDIEFYYESECNAPYYQYVDYSGTNLGCPGYSERISRVQSHYSRASLSNEQKKLIPDPLPTDGVDWFIRLRKGRSDLTELTFECRKRSE